jgi:nucleotidyltransferase AbiEii toxin of type IV toxin-antitoxin system
MSGSGKMDRDSWKQILASATAIFDALNRQGMDLPDVVMGGGTVLMLRFGHRLSKDIDLFLHDAQWLSILTPRLNDTAAAMVVDYVEQASNVKLVLPHGDIDFIVAGTVTGAEPAEAMDFMGYSFRLESTEEIIAKKLLYRAEHLKARDVFDLATVAEIDPDSAARALAATSSKRPVLKRRLEYLSRLSDEELARDILPIGDFSRILGIMLGTVHRLVDNMSDS